MAELKVTYCDPSDIIPYAMNSRTHSDEQINQVAASIKEFGFTNPILVDEFNVIIAGHGRLFAAKKLGLNQVPTITLKGLTEAQRKAYVIADNKLALNAGWDDDTLIAELNRLSELDFNLELTGFDANELARLFDDEEPELQEETYSEVFNVIVECQDEQEQEKIFNQLHRDGYKCRVQSL
jgi:ParB-like chromosome segregation protein Spo0J